MNDPESRPTSRPAPPRIPGDEVLPDPRRAAGFVPRHFPTANGAAALECEDPRNEALAMQFQAAYYEINLRYARLQDVRAQPGLPDFARRERAALQDIETALRQRDELEDRCAPLGIIAEPVARDGFTVDVRFTFGSTDASGRYRAEPIVSSAFLSFQVPESKRGRDLRPPAAGQTPCAD